MARKRLNRSDFFPYHITARANNRENFHLPIEHVWEMINFECFCTHMKYGMEFHSLVLMPNHFHMIASVPQFDLGIAMQSFMLNLTKSYNRTSRRSGHMFGGPYFWSQVDSARYFHHALKYVYRNPVRAGLAAKCEDYSFSTLSGLLGANPLQFPILKTRPAFECILPAENTIDFLPWLNHTPPEASDALIRLGLKKRIFRIPPDPETRASRFFEDY